MTSRRRPTLPPPLCPFGYPETQLRAILGDRYAAFCRWHVGQTGALCTGRTYNHETEREEAGCDPPHGAVVYPWDLRQFLAGGRDLEFAGL